MTLTVGPCAVNGFNSRGEWQTVIQAGGIVLCSEQEPPASHFPEPQRREPHCGVDR
jgi:hypothetical protein